MTPDFNAKPSRSMLIDAVDRTDKPIGVIERADALRQKTNFRTVHLFILNRNGQLLLQRLAENRSRNPLAWGSSVAAYLFAGESYEAAIIRRTVQELGVVPPVITEVGKIKMHDEGSLKFVKLFVTRCDGPFRIDTSHIAEIAFHDPMTISDGVQTDSQIFTPTFRTVFEFFTSHPPHAIASTIR